MQLQQVIEVLDEIAPPRNAETWDNVGLLVGDAKQNVSKAILTIDYTREVAAFAAGDSVLAEFASPVQAVRCASRFGTRYVPVTILFPKASACYSGSAST